MKLSRYILLASFGAQLTAQTSLVADDRDDAIKLLLEKVEALEQKVKVLERNGELKIEATEEKSKKTPTVIAGGDGFIIQSADTNFSLRVRGYGQFDTRLSADNGPAKDTFTIRRLRLGLEGTVFENYDYKVLTDFGSGITSTTANNAFLQDAFVNIHYWPQFQIQLGKFKEPVSLETLQTDANLLFVERGLPTQLAPNRDVGIMFQGELLSGKLSYQLGAFNGVPDGGSGDVEITDSDKDIAARLFAQPFRDSEKDWLRGLGLGIGSSIGNQEGAVPSFQTPGRQKFFSYRSGATATSTNVVADGEHWRVAPQGYYYWGPFGLFGEYVISSQQLRRDAGKTKTFGTVENGAWNVAVSYLLIDDQASWKPVNPRHRFSLREGGWGAWEIAARYGELSIDQAAFPLFAPSSSASKMNSWGIGLNWYLNKNLKFNFDYEQSHFTGGSKTPGSVTAQDEQLFISRAQFQF
jgi:phosphate-selective porin OprO/OprP